MLERLNQIALYDFIELLCGDYSVLVQSGDTVDDETLNSIASKLISQYQSIVNPLGTQAMVEEHEDRSKEKMNLLLLRVCQALLSLNAYEDVRTILAALDYNCLSLTDEQIKLKTEGLVRAALFEQKRKEELRQKEECKHKKSTPEQIRASFDAEIAFMMTYFKMPIDIHITNAAVYANIVHQADVDIRNKLRSR